jgi:hypothetical protein
MFDSIKLVTRLRLDTRPVALNVILPSAMFKNNNTQQKQIPNKSQRSISETALSSNNLCKSDIFGLENAPE